MKLQILCADIATVASDTLIYSTNVRLAWTGGVGAALAVRFGIGVQIDLQSQSSGTGRQLAEVGDIFDCRIEGGPWRHVFHTIATDELYHTKPEVVRSLLRRCLQRCAQKGDVRSITCSPLGAGYGDLEIPEFAAIAHAVYREFSHASIDQFTIVTNDPKEAELLASTLAALERQND
jgi:O-acetyl-ADP-ribose deacetylase (regulator of RNase III)